MDLSKTSSHWSNHELKHLSKYKGQLYDMDQENAATSILQKQSNQMSFYKIVPKEELPKDLQKSAFQSISSKEGSASSVFKIWKKQKMDRKQNRIRRMLRQNGQIMLLSEIYNYLDDPLEAPCKQENISKNQTVPLSNIINELDQWQKNSCSQKKASMAARYSKARQPSNANCSEERRNSSHKKQFMVKKFKIGSDYRLQIEKSLDVIWTTHNSEQNQMSKFSLIENSSKLLKKQLEQMKQIVQKQIEEKMKKLTESRKQHHRLFQQKLRLHLQQQQLDQQKIKEEGGVLQNIGYGYHSHSQNNMKNIYEEKKNQIQKNQGKIIKIKKNIQFLEEQVLKNQQELKNIILAETSYYKLSLKYGLDCRQTGLVWIIKKLGIQESDVPHTEFPEYLDKKSRFYLIAKFMNEQKLQEMLRQKKQFVNQIGKDGSMTPRRSSIRSRKSSIKLNEPINVQHLDQIRQGNSHDYDGEIPKRYRRSMKKISALREQFVKNQNLFKLTQSRSGPKLGCNLTGMTGRQIYDSVSEKIKQINFSKIKKQKAFEKNDKIYQYQSILRKIEDLHIQMQQQDIQHQNHLLSVFRDNKQLFFTIAAACFGVKRAYSLIIKNFSWKNCS